MGFSYLAQLNVEEWQLFYHSLMFNYAKYEDPILSIGYKKFTP